MHDAMSSFFIRHASFFSCNNGALLCRVRKGYCLLTQTGHVFIIVYFSFFSKRIVQ